MNSQSKEFIEYCKVCFPLHFVNKNVLDVGITLNNIDSFFTECEYYITDITIDDDTTNRQLLSSNDLLFDDEYFDIILCTESLEYDPNWKNAILNIERMLKKQGLLIMIINKLDNADIDSNLMTIYRANKILNFNDVFYYWDCYLDNNANTIFFIGFKKFVDKDTNIDTNMDIIISDYKIPDIKYDNNISRIKNSNLTILSESILYDSLL